PERRAEIDDRLLHGALGHVKEPGELRPLDRIEIAPQRDFGRLAASLVLPLPFAQCPVPGPTCCAACPRKIEALSRIGFKRDLMGEQHRSSPPSPACAWPSARRRDGPRTP